MAKKAAFAAASFANLRAAAGEGAGEPLRIAIGIVFLIVGIVLALGALRLV